MNDRELNEKLKAAKEEADRFFAAWKFNPYRKMIYRRLENPDNYTDSDAFNSPWRLVFNKKVVLASLLLILLALNLFNFSPFKQSPNIGVPISQQPIRFGDNSTTKWVSFFRLDEPDRSKNSLLAVIWDSSPDGDYKMIYSSLLENCDIPHPVSVMDFPGSSSKLLLISSGNKNSGHLHYRLIEYDDSSRAFVTYLEQDFVPYGKVNIEEGIIVEERTVPGIYSAQENEFPRSKGKTVVTRLVPYKIDSKGNLILPTDYIRLNRGDYLTFIGYNTGQHLKITLAGRILDNLHYESFYLTDMPYIQLHAVNPGKGVIILETDMKSGPRKELKLEIEERR